MTGLYIFGVLVVIGIAVLIFYKTKWSRQGKAEIRGREANIEKERIEEVAKAAARQKN
jgi:hypothetical protein